MSRETILIDANSYLRLANLIQPLLNAPFGTRKVTLFVIDEIKKELESNTRLVSEFSWVGDPEYSKNRKDGLFRPKKAQKTEIEDINQYLWDFKKDMALSASPADIACLATAQVLNLTLVTDDGDMHIIAKEYNIKICRTLELLKMLLDDGCIDKSFVKSIYQHWQRIDDLPANAAKDFARLFQT